MKPRIIVIGRFVEDRVFGPALAGARRYAKAREWDVETIGWNEARTGFPKALQAPPRPLGFIVEGNNLPPDPVELSRYKAVVSTIPLPGVANVRILGEGTEGSVLASAELGAMRKAFAAEIAADSSPSPRTGPKSAVFRNRHGLGDGGSLGQECGDGAGAAEKPSSSPRLRGLSEDGAR